MPSSTSRRATRPTRSQRMTAARAPRRPRAGRRRSAARAWVLRAVAIRPRLRRARARSSPPPSAAEHRAPRVRRVAAELLLDAQELVVLGDAIGARRRAGLDLPAAGGDGEV